MSTFSEIKSKLIFLLGDSPDSGTDLSDDLLRDSVYAALDAILPFVWKPRTSALAGGSSSYALPADLYEVQAVWSENLETYIDPAMLAPGEPQATTSGNAWFEYPHGYLSLYTALGDSGGVLYYAAQWSKPATDADVLDIPVYATTGVVLYAASYATLYRAAAQARLSNYKTRMDSGTPEDNPLSTFSNFLLKRFDIEMARMPKITKGIR